MRGWAAPLDVTTRPILSEIDGGEPPTINESTRITSTTENRVDPDAIQIMPISATAYALALAMDISEEDLKGAQLGCQDRRCTVSDTVAVLGMAPRTWFPVAGESFALLSTGHSHDWATDYPAVQYPMAYASRKDALLNTQGQDMTQLQLQLQVPVSATCLSFDYAFYTADLPLSAFSGRPDPFNPYNDTFTAQLNSDVLEVITPTTAAVVVAPVVNAPNNFALTPQGQMISVNTIDQVNTALSLSSPRGTTYPGVFPLRKARTPVESGTLISLTLSIQDLGDSLGNSAVALDNFEWLTEAESDGCQTGVSGDQDGDGLPDRWETHGKHWCYTPGTCIVVNLKEMGADPITKDVFVEIDYMQPINRFDPVPIPKAMALIIDAFANAPVDEREGLPGEYQGIRLHIDYTSTLPLATTPIWTAKSGEILPLHCSDRSCANQIPQSRYLGGDFGCRDDQDALAWAGVQRIKHEYFDPHRAAIFHYAIFAHMFYNCDTLRTTSGASRNLPEPYFTHGASDFVVTFGNFQWAYTPYISTTRQAGTFMHELGHNFGLMHSGTIRDKLTYKPNHLSVMNYLYQLGGIPGEKWFRFDYVKMPPLPLNEAELYEEAGLQVPPTMKTGAKYFCPNGEIRTVENARRVDWNCDKTVDTHNTRVDLDNSNAKGSKYDILAVESEWDKLVFTGGELNRQRNLVNSGVLLVPVLDPVRGIMTRQPYYRDLEGWPGDLHINDELDVVTVSKLTP